MFVGAEDPFPTQRTWRTLPVEAYHVPPLPWGGGTVPLRVGMILSEGAGGCKVPQDLHCVPFSISMRTGPSARYIRSISRGSSITYVVLRRDTHLVGARALRAWKIFWYQGIGVLVYHCLYVKVPAHIRKRNNNTTSTIVGAPESTPCPTLTTHPASLKALPLVLDTYEAAVRVCRGLSAQGV